MLFPHIKAYDPHDVAEDLLQGRTLATILVSAIQGALNDDGVEVGEDLIFLKNH